MSRISSGYFTAIRFAVNHLTPRSSIGMVSRGEPSWFEGGVNHFDIDATPWVHQIIIHEIAKTFPLPCARRAPHQTVRGPMTELGARSDRTWPALEMAPPWRPTSQVPSNSFEAPPFVPEQVERPSIPVWRPDRPKPPVRNGASP